MRFLILTPLFPLLALCAPRSLNTTTPSNMTKSTTNTSVLCISLPDAALIAESFGQILSNYTAALGDQLIADTYTDQSDSVATMMYSPNLNASLLGTPTFSSKPGYLASEASQPRVPFTLLNTWSSCSAVTFRYALHPPGGLDVQGIAVAEVVAAAGNATGVGAGEEKWQIGRFWGEFNSAVWLTGLGTGVCDVSGGVGGV